MALNVYIAYTTGMFFLLTMHILFADPDLCYGEKMLDCAEGLTCILTRGEPHCEGMSGCH